MKNAFKWVLAILAAILVYFGLAIFAIAFGIVIGVLIITIAVVGLAEEIKEGWKK